MLIKLEKIFTRSFLYAFNKKKFFFAYPFTFVCGIIFLFFRSLSINSSKWMNLCFNFLSIFIIFSILYILSVFLMRVYYHEVKNLKCSYGDILKSSFEKSFHILYISILSIFSFIVLWILFGFLALIKEIPHIGAFLGIFISFITYIIMMIFVFLVIFNFLSLFFVVPQISLKPKVTIKNIFQIVCSFKEKLFLKAILFFVSFFSLYFVSYILFIGASLTKIYFPINLNSIYIGLDEFFIMIPFTILITPFLIFYFNFAIESFNLIYKKD
jgi:hypothetical protein